MDPLNEALQKVQNALQHLQKDLSAIRAGRANPSLLEEIPVMAYGARMKLMEVGTITSPQPTLLTVQVWDSTIVKDVEKAISTANLGLTTSAEGSLIRVPIPPLTQERRDEFSKLAKVKGEDAKIEIRQIRNDEKGRIEQLKESGDVSEDQMHYNLDKLQELIEKSNTQIEEYVKAKEEELQQI